MTTLPPEWHSVPVFYRWPTPELQRRYDGTDVVLDDPDGDEVIRSDTVADDVIGDLEKLGTAETATAAVGR
jgi:hypothetical protein